MKATLRKFFFVLLSTLLISMLLPMSASAENPNSTLGNETPYMYCTFLDAEGKEVDGNALSAGDYTVDVRVGEMANASILQFTADYDSTVITALSVTGTIADDANSSVSLGGIKDENDKLVIALVSEDENNSALTNEFGTSIATMAVTIDAAEGTTVDFEDVFSFSNDPDLTFLEADYADGYNDAYVTDTTVTTPYNTYLMTADSSPNFLTVSGKVVIATQLDGETGENGIGGISVYPNVNYDPAAVTASDGTFTASVPRGTTSLILSNHTFENGVHSLNSEGCTIDREVTLGGKTSVNYNGVIPVITCDWNSDGAVSPADKQTLLRQTGKMSTDEDFYVYCDINSDGSVSPADKQVYLRFVGSVDSNYEYPAKTLQ